MRSEAEIREMLESLRKQYDESEKNPVKCDPRDYLTTGYKRREQARRELAWMDEIAVLEWVLKEKPAWLTSWARKKLDEKDGAGA